MDWALGSAANIPFSYLIELRDTGELGFLLPPEYISIVGAETWAGVKAMAIAIDEKTG